VKVGGLDDPVWRQAQEGVPPSQGRPSRRRGLLVLIVGVPLVLLAVALTLWASQSHRRGGDPGGRILRELLPNLAAVPAGSTDVVTQKLDSVWSEKCPDNLAGQAGWSEVRADARFTIAWPRERVINSVSSVLAENGWTRHDESFGPAQGSVAHWTKHLAAGVSAEAAVYPVPADSTNWFLTATARPPGFASAGC